MTRLRRAAIYAAIAAVALACQARPGQPVPDSDRPAHERIADDNVRTVTIEVTRATGPYSVWVRAHRVGEARGDHWRDDYPAEYPYEQTLTYESGLRIEVAITVIGHPADVYGCRISDGDAADEQEGRGTVYCSLVTSR